MQPNFWTLSYSLFKIDGPERCGALIKLESRFFIFLVLEQLSHSFVTISCLQKTKETVNRQLNINNTTLLPLISAKWLYFFRFYMAMYANNDTINKNMARCAAR